MSLARRMPLFRFPQKSHRQRERESAYQGKHDEPGPPDAAGPPPDKQPGQRSDEEKGFEHKSNGDGIREGGPQDARLQKHPVEECSIQSHKRDQGENREPKALSPALDRYGIHSFSFARVKPVGHVTTANSTK